MEENLATLPYPSLHKRGQIVVEILETGGNVDFHHNLPSKYFSKQKGQFVVKIHVTPCFKDFHHNLPLFEYCLELCRDATSSCGLG